MSNLWTTTTSATGMPTVERDGGVPNNISCNVPGSPRSGSPTPAYITSSKHLGRVKSLPHSLIIATDSRLPPNEVCTVSPIARKLSSESGAFTAVWPEKASSEDNCKTCGCPKTLTCVEEVENGHPSDKMTIQSMSFMDKGKPTIEEVVAKAKNCEYSEELDKLYDKIDSWNFPIFDVWARGNVLRGVSCID